MHFVIHQTKVMMQNLIYLSKHMYEHKYAVFVLLFDVAVIVE